MISSKSEKLIENKIKNYMKSKDIHFDKTHGSAFTPPGVHDLVCCIKGRYVTFEVKRERGGVISEAQKRYGKRVDRSLGMHYFVNSFETAKMIIDSYLEMEPVEHPYW